MVVAAGIDAVDIVDDPRCSGDRGYPPLLFPGCDLPEEDTVKLVDLEEALVAHELAMLRAGQSPIVLAVAAELLDEGAYY